MSESDKRSRAIQMAVAQIERQFGKGSIMRMGEEKGISIPTISSGSLADLSALVTNPDRLLISYDMK